MTKPFTPAQKFRILVMHGAMMLAQDTAIPIARFPWATLSSTKRYEIAKRLNCVVRCACGCGVWAPLAEIDFDHKHEHVNGGLTAISNGAPLRRQPCHAAKTAASAAVTGKVTSCRNKLSVPLGLKPRDDNHHQPGVRRGRAWPTRSLRHPLLRRRFDGTVERLA